jgi:ribosomal protein S18 acetylase RimI-like enzyme
MTDWTVRLATPADFAVVLAADVFDGPAQAPSTRRFLGPSDSDAPQNILMIAEATGKIVGFASAIVTDHPDKARSLFIVELGVNEDAQRRGIGRALLSAIRAEGRTRGCSSSWVLTEADNGPARAVYAAAGGDETPGVVMYAWQECAREQ